MNLQFKLVHVCRPARMLPIRKQNVMNKEIIQSLKLTKKHPVTQFQDTSTYKNLNERLSTCTLKFTTKK